MGFGMSQKPDDEGDLGEEIGRQPRPVSKAAFGCLSWTLFFVIMITELAIATALSTRLGDRKSVV